MKQVSPITSYHTNSFDLKLRKKNIETCIRAISQFPENVGLVFTGISGMAIGFPVADRTGREFAVVRKDNDSLHASQRVEGYPCLQYVIIDDFIDLGKTMDRIISRMNDARINPKCYGIILYGSSYRDIDYKSIPILHDRNNFKLIS